MWINRSDAERIRSAVKTRPALLLTGMRQAGKSSLLQKLFPEAMYVTLDDFMLAREAHEKPQHFLARFNEVDRVIIDEIQYAPMLFRELKILIDRDRMKRGKWILTGSQRFSLMNQVSESLAGRISIIELATLSAGELRDSEVAFTADELIKRGGFPELWATREIDFSEYYSDYVKTYIERDVRNLLKIGDLHAFQKFMQLIALRSGNLLNYMEVAKDASLSPNTVKSWVSVLESSGVVAVLSPYYENLGKRLIKTPKLYFSDTGLLSWLLGIRKDTNIWNLPFVGHLWENFTISEVLKRTEGGSGMEVFFFRDSNGVELDALLLRGDTIIAIEAKSSERPDERKLNFRKVLPLFESRGYKTEAIISAPVPQGKVILGDFAYINPVLENFPF